MYDYRRLNNGIQIPCIGFGTYKATDGKGAEKIREALKAGYRHFDTAAFYKNEEEIGEALFSSDISREEVFFTSKVWKEDMGAERTRKSLEASLRKLGLEYLDLYLIHWPRRELGTKSWQKVMAETWKTMEELYEEEKVRAIGVSNFMPHHLEALEKTMRVCPAVNQIEFHPGHTQEVTLRYCQEKGILVEAWSPLGRKRVLEHPLITELSDQYQVSPAQLCIRYALQRGVIPLPKASSPERMRQNLDVFGFEIGREDMYRIGSMPPAGWSGEHPDFERVYFE